MIANLNRYDIIRVEITPDRLKEMASKAISKQPRLGDSTKYGCIEGGGMIVEFHWPNPIKPIPKDIWEWYNQQAPFIKMEWTGQAVRAIYLSMIRTGSNLKEVLEQLREAAGE